MFRNNPKFQYQLHNFVWSVKEMFGISGFVMLGANVKCLKNAQRSAKELKRHLGFSVSIYSIF